VSVTSERILVRAPVGVVYATLTDVDGWPSWWRGCRSARTLAPQHPDDGLAEGDHHRLVLGGPWRRQTLHLRAHGWRHDAGLHCALRDRRGRAIGSAEWWLEECAEGSIVHHILHGSGPDRERARYLRAVRFGLQDLKDHLELAVALAAGRLL
jgi:uncharacterized protein YndB with AHSA1/START domain